MTPTTKNMLRATALLLPTVLLCVGVFYNLAALDTAPTIRVPVAGYDPIDVLHGHYIQFRFDQDAFLERDTTGAYGSREGQCVCLKNIEPLSNGQNIRGSFVSCQKKAEMQCDFWSANPAFFWGSHKYFVDERRANQLDKLVRDITPRARPRRNAQQAQQSQPPEPSRVTVDIAMTPSGAMQFKMLNIDGKPWTEAVH